jgi:O-antigen ligase
MSALPLRAGGRGLRLEPDAALYALGIAAGLGLGLALRSALLLAIAGLAGAVVAVRVAPEISLVLLASEGTLKSLYPFSELPVDLLLVTLGLTFWACVVVTRVHGLPRIPPASALIIVLAALLVVAVMRSSLPGATAKAVYFEVVPLALFFSAFVLVRDLRALTRLAIGFVVVGFIVAHAASPSTDPSQPYTLPGGSEIEAALYPAFGALAAVTCVAMRVRGRWRLLALALGVALAAAAARAGSRGVLLSLLGAAIFAGILLIAHARRPVLTFALVALVGLGAVETGRAVISPAALSRYEGLTTDPRRAYLRTRAVDQALARPFGNGVGAFGLNLPVLNPRPAVPYPHNVALEIFGESGIFALGALAGLVGASLLAALRVARRPGAAFCAVGMVFALLEAFASGNVNDDHLLWMTLGVALAAPGLAAMRDG